MSQIVVVAADVIIATLPVELSVTMLLVIVVIACVLIAIMILLILLPLAFAMLHSLLEFTNIESSTFPSILPIAIRLTIDILARKHILIGKEISALPILE